MRAQRFQATLEAEAVGEHLTRHCRLSGLQRIENAEIQRIEAELERQVVEKLLLRQRALRHAEAAKGAGGLLGRLAGGRRRWRLLRD